MVTRTDNNLEPLKEHCEQLDRLSRLLEEYFAERRFPEFPENQDSGVSKGTDDLWNQTR